MKFSDEVIRSDLILEKKGVKPENRVEIGALDGMITRRDF